MGEVIETVQRILGTDKPVECRNETRRNEMNNVVADISHAESVLGWHPSHTLEQGLTVMTETYRA